VATKMGATQCQERVMTNIDHHGILVLENLTVSPDLVGFQYGLCIFQVAHHFLDKLGTLNLPVIIIMPMHLPSLNLKPKIVMWGGWRLKG